MFGSASDADRDRADARCSSSTAVIVTGVVIAHCLMRKRTLESVVARTSAPSIAVRAGRVMAFADRHLARTGQCLHLLPVLTSGRACA